MEKHESEVNALAGEKKGLEEVLRAKDKEIARLNERIDSLLLASLDDNQKRADLQNEIEALEKQLKEKQPTPTPSPQVEAQSIMSSSSILELLGTTRQRVEELEEAKRGIARLGGRVEKTETYDIDGAPRCVIVIRKERPTPPAYPRRYAKIKQSPL